MFTSCKGRSSFTSNATAIRHSLGCSTNKHFIHSGLLRRLKLFFFFFFFLYNRICILNSTTTQEETSLMKPLHPRWTSLYATSRMDEHIIHPSLHSSVRPATNPCIIPWYYFQDSQSQSTDMVDEQNDKSARPTEQCVIHLRASST